MSTSPLSVRGGREWSRGASAGPQERTAGGRMVDERQVARRSVSEQCVQRGGFVQQQRLGAHLHRTWLSSQRDHHQHDDADSGLRSGARCPTGLRVAGCDRSNDVWGTTCMLLRKRRSLACSHRLGWHFDPRRLSGWSCWVVRVAGRDRSQCLCSIGAPTSVRMLGETSRSRLDRTRQDMLERERPTSLRY